jgi:hypothetical protein
VFPRPSHTRLRVWLSQEDFSVRKCLDKMAGIVTANEVPVAGGGEGAAADAKVRVSLCGWRNFIF